jgi:hypothetical protein
VCQSLIDHLSIAVVRFQEASNAFDDVAAQILALISSRRFEARLR